MYSATVPDGVWQGRSDALPDEYVFQYVRNLTIDESLSPARDENAFILLGFASDEGVRRNQGRPGANSGPDAFRKAFANFPVHHPLPLYDGGNVECRNRDLGAAQLLLGQKVTDLLLKRYRPIIIGGGHETAWGQIQGIIDYFARKQIDTDRLAVLNFDAHLDCRPLIGGKKGSSGTPFFQACEALKARKKKLNYFCVGVQPFSNTRSLFEYANQEGFHYLTAQEIRQNPLNTNFAEYVIDQFDYIYVTICLDVFSASIAPGVSSPQVLGIAPDYVLKSLRKLRQSSKVISLDIVELAPCHDPDHRTAKLAASLMAEYLFS